MRKTLIFLLIFALLCPVSASAAEPPKYLALIFDGCPPDPEALLRGLEERRVRVTFFLGPEDAPRAELLRARGHEVGILTDMGTDNWYTWMGIVVTCFVAPACLSLIFSAILRKMGWIRENDMKLAL